MAEKENPIGILLDRTAKEAEIWPRFSKVREVILDCIVNPQGPNSDLVVDSSAYDWTGADDGWHDYHFKVFGEKNNTFFNMFIKGSQFKNRNHNERELTISGNFISKDQKEGRVEIGVYDGKIGYEAYWLQCLDGDLMLAQVVNPDGVVFELDQLEKMSANTGYYHEHDKDGSLFVPKFDEKIPLKQLMWLKKARLEWLQKSQTH